MLHRNRPTTSLAIIGVALLALAGASSAQAPAPAPAQIPPPNPALNGAWRLQGTVEQAQAIVTAAVDPAVSTLAPDIQRLARARIAESTGIPPTIEIHAEPSRILVAITGPDGRSFESAPGTPQNVYSRSGVRAELTQTYRPDGAIEQRFRAMDGTQWNFYTPQPDGTLALDVLMRSRRLTQDVRFQITFTR